MVTFESEHGDSMFPKPLVLTYQTTRCHGRASNNMNTLNHECVNMQAQSASRPRFIRFTKMLRITTGNFQSYIGLLLKQTVPGHLRWWRLTGIPFYEIHDAFNLGFTLLRINTIVVSVTNIKLLNLICV
jgi:hypothetical protein